MKKILSLVVLLSALHAVSFAQEKRENKHKIKVPIVVQTALAKKYHEATKVTWEKEKGNYEANWGGRSGEDNSVQFTSAGNFIEIVNAIPVSELPKSVSEYVTSHYHHSKITEAGKVTDASGKQTYEAEVKGKDLIFDIKGKYLKKD